MASSLLFCRQPSFDVGRQAGGLFPSERDRVDQGCDLSAEGRDMGGRRGAGLSRRLLGGRGSMLGVRQLPLELAGLFAQAPLLHSALALYFLPSRLGRE
ncbi:hypothetical protein [Streptomyces sp. I05A-00742]|uniref:hypothetical protein n=1 Tax=Streptomyces sp. I05A-00742 TaxID=2732853 RepID=UPI0020180312|nr:hypothetical protein [Streptomyces sp. I05A-00742]